MFVNSKSNTFFRRFRRDKRGNVFMMMGFAIIPITMAAGMTVDYTRAARLKTKLDAVADAAVLSAVTEASKNASDKVVCERAAALFTAQASAIPDISYIQASSISISVGSPSLPGNAVYNGTTNTCSNPAAGNPASNAANRVVSLSYGVQSNNFFGKLFDRNTLPVSGRAASESATSPDIDFYVALDTSPSMALPVTTAGIDALVNATAMWPGAQNSRAYDASFTPTKKGCAFACHSNKIQVYVGSSLGELVKDNAKYAIVKEAAGRTGVYGGNPIVYIDSADTWVYLNGKKNCSTACVTDINVYNADGSYVDTYWYARNKGIALRVDEMRRATADLVDTALTQSNGSGGTLGNGATYRAAIFGFDYEANYRRIYPSDPNTNDGLVTIAKKNPDAATTAAGNAFRAVANSSAIEAALVNDLAGNGCPAPNAACTGSNRYLFTSFKGLLEGMATTLPATSGAGTRAVGDTPQKILFIITDGMSDEKASIVGGINSLGSDRTRAELTGLLPNPGSRTHLKKCETIKSRGIRIAILYTEYTRSSIASDEAGQRDWVSAKLYSPGPPIVPDTVAARLIDCASPGLMLKVSTDGDISAALTALFLKATTAPRLVK